MDKKEEHKAARKDRPEPKDGKDPAHDARSSTSVNPGQEEPIDPKMPEMPPA